MRSRLHASAAVTNVVVCNAQMSQHTHAALDIAAHELRTALGIISQGAQLLAEDEQLSDDSRSIGVDMRHAGVMLAWFVDRAIECARCEQGREPERHMIALGDLITQSIRRAKRAGMAVSEVPLVAPDAHVCVDAQAAERVLADAMISCAGIAPPHITVQLREAEWEITIRSDASHHQSPVTGAVLNMMQVLALAAGVDVIIASNQAQVSIPIA